MEGTWYCFVVLKRGHVGSAVKWFSYICEKRGPYCPTQLLCHVRYEPSVYHAMSGTALAYDAPVQCGRYHPSVWRSTALTSRL
eukprot:3864862-Rhodomonas_salina.1